MADSEEEETYVWKCGQCDEEFPYTRNALGVEGVHEVFCSQQCADAYMGKGPTPS